MATVADFYLTDHFWIWIQVYGVIVPPQHVVPSSFNMRNLHGITNRLYVGRSSPRLWPKQGSHPRPQQVAYLLGSMKRVLGRDLFHRSRETRSDKTANGFQFPSEIIILEKVFADSALIIILRKVVISLFSCLVPHFGKISGFWLTHSTAYL